MKKPNLILISAVLVIGISTTFVGTAQASSAKAGVSCTTAGATQISGGKRYICQAEARQDHFQWDDGTPTSFKAKIPIVLPIPEATGPNAITFANVMSHIADIPSVAYQNVQNVITKNSSIVVPHALYVGPKTTSVTKTLEESLLSKEFRLWEGFQQSSFVNIIAYNNLDTNWAQQQFKTIFKVKGYATPQDPQEALHLVQQTCSKSSKPGQTTGPMGDCYAGNAGGIDKSKDSLMMLGVTTADPQHPWDPTQSGEVSHEYTHTVQAAQFIGTASTARSYYVHITTPCWIHEGQPNATGIAAASPTLSQYLDKRNATVSSGPLDPKFPGWTAAALKSYLYSQIPNESVSNSCYQNGPLYKMGYSVGMAATEALVAIAGPQSTMALIAREADGDTFAQAFKNVYGITWEAGSTILGRVLSAEYAQNPFVAK